MHKIILSASLGVLFGAGAVLSAPLGTAITYQGVLTDAGTPVSGTFDLHFGLFDQASGGSELGAVIAEDLVVTDGRVSATVDFGDQWNGDARWLEIGVREGSSTGAFQTLPARQQLLTTPIGLFAIDADGAAQADHAVSAASASTLDGQTGDFYRAFSNISGVPSGIADGDDDTAAALSCAVGETPSWDGGAWVCAPDDPGPFTRTVVVGPVGSPSENGDALLDMIGDLPNPASAGEGWLVQIEPGLYDVGPSPVAIPRWTTVRGSSTTLTVIRGTLCGSASGQKATVMLADGAELRDLTIENTCASASDAGRALIILSGSSNVRVSRVTATEDGGASCSAVLNQGSATVMERVVGRVPACDGSAVGIGTVGANALLLDCEGSAVGFSSAQGLSIAGRAWVERGVFAGSSTSGSGATGIMAFTNADLRNVESGSIWVGAYETNQIVTVSRSIIAGPVIASDQGGNLLVAVEQSTVAAPSQPTVIGDSNTAIGVAMSQLIGDPVSPSGGLIACAGVWDGSWTPYASTCP
jgi:hypothetical protein